MSVLSSIEQAGRPRPIMPGEYHVSDLLTRTALEIAEWHTGARVREGIPGWLSVRGLAVEDAVLRDLPAEMRNPCLSYYVGSGATIIGHPDYVLSDGSQAELGEVKSQLSDDDDAREDLALEQALAYAALINNGATLTPAPTKNSQHPPRDDVGIHTIRVILAGLWSISEREYPVHFAATNALFTYMTSKVVVIHDAVTTRDLTRLENYDATNPPRGAPEWKPTPVATGELGELADELVHLHAERKLIETRYEELRGRWFATLDLENKKILAPGGGSIGLNAKTEKVLDLEAWTRLGGSKLEEACALARAALNATPAAQELAAAQQALDTARARSMNETKVPGHIRVYPAKGA